MYTYSASRQFSPYNHLKYSISPSLLANNNKQSPPTNHEYSPRCPRFLTQGTPQTPKPSLREMDAFEKRLGMCRCSGFCLGYSSYGVLAGWTLMDHGRDFALDSALRKGIRPVAVPTRHFIVSPGPRKMLVTKGTTFWVL